VAGDCGGHLILEELEERRELWILLLELRPIFYTTISEVAMNEVVAERGVAFATTPPEPGRLAATRV
jgi:hypothetical protein